MIVTCFHGDRQCGGGGGGSLQRSLKQVSHNRLSTTTMMMRSKQRRIVVTRRCRILQHLKLNHDLRVTSHNFSRCCAVHHESRTHTCTHLIARRRRRRRRIPGIASKSRVFLPNPAFLGRFLFCKPFLQQQSRSSASAAALARPMTGIPSSRARCVCAPLLEPPPPPPSDSKRHGASRTEVAAFVGMILSVIFFLTYVAWAIVPDSVLTSFGISYFPNKYWSVALPLYGIMLGLFTVVGYIALSMYHNPDLNDIRLAEDKFSKARSLPPSPPPSTHARCRATPPARAWR